MNGAWEREHVPEPLVDVEVIDAHYEVPQDSGELLDMMVTRFEDAISRRERELYGLRFQLENIEQALRQAEQRLRESEQATRQARNDYDVTSQVNRVLERENKRLRQELDELRVELDQIRALEQRRLLQQLLLSPC